MACDPRTPDGAYEESVGSSDSAGEDGKRGSGRERSVSSSPGFALDTLHNAQDTDADEKPTTSERLRNKLKQRLAGIEDAELIANALDETIHSHLHIVRKTVDDLSNDELFVTLSLAVLKMSRYFRPKAMREIRQKALLVERLERLFDPEQLFDLDIADSALNNLEGLKAIVAVREAVGDAETFLVLLQGARGTLPDGSFGPFTISTLLKMCSDYN